MKKLKIRFCEWNAERLGTAEVMRLQQTENRDLADVELLHCLGNCSICNQGPFCAVNDLLFQKKTPEQLNLFLNDLLGKLRKALEAREREKAANKKEYALMNDTAVVIIDVQNDYCHPQGVFAQGAKFSVDAIPAIYPNINRLVGAARAKGMPVIWVKMMWDNDEEVGILSSRSTFLKHEGLRRGTWGAELVEELDVRGEDIVVEKKRFSAFYETELEQVLQQHGIKKLITGGVRTDFCVESTVRDAFFRDYDVTIASDCVASYFPRLHDGSLQVMGTVFAKIKPTQDIVAELS